MNALTISDVGTDTFCIKILHVPKLFIGSGAIWEYILQNWAKLLNSNQTMGSKQMMTMSLVLHIAAFAVEIHTVQLYTLPLHSISSG